MEFLGFQHGIALFVRIHNKHGGRQSGHVLDTAIALFQIKNLFLLAGHFLLGKQIESAVLLHLGQAVETGDGLLDGLEVGHHAARPTDIDIVHTATGSLFFDGVCGLFLGTDEKDGAVIGGEVTHKSVGFFKLLHGLLQVNDIDPVAFREDVFLHFRVPSSGVVSEMNTGFKQLFNGND